MSSFENDSDVDPLPPRYVAPPARSSSKESIATTPRRATPRNLDFVKKYVELDLFAKEWLSGKLTNLTDDEKRQRYGSTKLPVFVPLARGESFQQYEERFADWLRRRKHMSVKELETTSDKLLARNYWSLFARENAKGSERFESNNESTNKRARVACEDEDNNDDKEELPKSKKFAPQSEKTREKETKPEPVKTSTTTSCMMKPPAEDAPRTKIIAAYVACGCRRCLMKGIWHMAKKVGEVEAKIDSTVNTKCSSCSTSSFSTTRVVVEDDGRQSPAPSVRSVASSTGSRPTSASKLSSSTTREANAITKLVLSRPSPAELVAQAAQSFTKRAPLETEEDPVERQLASEYEEINDQVIMNENVLEASAARLASTPVSDIHETTRLQDENQELRGFVQDEVDNRNAALALLVVYLWRHERPALEKLVNDKGVCDVVHVQRSGHHKCSALSIQIVEKREYAAKIKTQLDAVMSREDQNESKRLTMMTSLGGMLAKAETELKTLRLQRKREFATLIHFDAHLRVLIHTLLDAAAM